MRKAVNKDGTIARPGRHLHFKGCWETWVNRLLKPNHAIVTWHLKRNVIKVLSLPSVNCVLTTPPRQQGRPGKGPWAFQVLAADSTGTGIRVSPDHTGSKFCGHTLKWMDYRDVDIGSPSTKTYAQTSLTILEKSRFPSLNTIAT